MNWMSIEIVYTAKYGINDFAAIIYEYWLFAEICQTSTNNNMSHKFYIFETIFNFLVAV